METLRYITFFVKNEPEQFKFLVNKLVDLNSLFCETMFYNNDKDATFSTNVLYPTSF